MLLLTVRNLKKKTPHLGVLQRQNIRTNFTETGKIFQKVNWGDKNM